MSASDQQDQDQPRWRILLRPRWLVWTGFCVVACVGMLALGDWQLHRALSGNELSWAYTFEWPLFALFCGYFWVRTCREELTHPADAETESSDTTMLSAAESDSTVSASADTSSGRPDGEPDEAYVARLRAEIQSDPRWRAHSRGRR